MALTKRDIDRLAWDPDRPKATQILPDGTIPGFGVRVYPSAKKSFVLRYRPKGATQPKNLTIGPYGPITLDQARKLASKELLKVKDGSDPQAERKQARQGDTLREFATIYMEKHAKHKKSHREDKRLLEKILLPKLGSSKLKDVERTDIRRLVDKTADRSRTEANKLVALVSVMWNLAADWGHLPEDHPNVAARVKKFKIKSREVWVKPAELPALTAAIEAEPDPYIRAAFKLYLLTGVRKQELLSLRWKDVDFDRLEIRLEDTKAGRPHVVPLSAPAVEMLNSLPRQLGGAYVFPGKESGKPRVNITKAWYRVRGRWWLATNPEAAERLRAQAEADVQQRSKHAEKTPAAVEARLLALAAAEGEDKLRVHDLRRTVGSWLATNGASLPLIGKVLNHTNTSTTQIYARLSEDPIREVLEQHGERMGRMLGAENL